MNMMKVFPNQKRQRQQAKSLTFFLLCSKSYGFLSFSLFSSTLNAHVLIGCSY